MTRPRRRRKSEPVAVGRAIGRVLDDLGLEEARTAWEIGQGWREFVGQEAAGHSRPLAIRHGVLEVEVDSSVRAQQLSLQRPQIAAALGERFGERAPSGIRFRVGSLA